MDTLLTFFSQCRFSAAETEIPMKPQKLAALSDNAFTRVWHQYLICKPSGYSKETKRLFCVLS